jgi:hypothetical protein
MCIEMDCHRGFVERDGNGVTDFISSHFIMMELMARVVIIDSYRPQRTFKVPNRLSCFQFIISLYVDMFSIIRAVVAEADLRELLMLPPPSYWKQVSQHTSGTQLLYDSCKLDFLYPIILLSC